MVDHNHSGNGIDERINNLEKQVAANIVQIAAMEKALSDLSRPTNWFVILGTVGATLSSMIVFVNLIAGPIDAKLKELQDQHYSFLDRFNAHVEADDSKAIRARVDANKEADLARDSANFERAKEIADLNTRDIDRIRQQIARIENELRERATTTKPNGSLK